VSSLHHAAQRLGPPTPLTDDRRPCVVRRFLSSRRFHALLLFSTVFSLSGFSALKNRQLDYLGGMTDEWYYLGANLNVTGVLGLGDTPIVLRPPGYPAFIALVLRAFAGTPPRATETYLTQAKPAVYLAQAVLLAFSAVLLYLWLSSCVRSGVALLVALGFGASPFCIVLTGLFHYDIVHMVLLIAGCLALERSLRRRAPAILPMVFCGLLWGGTTLVRPQTLILPVFVLGALVLRTGFELRPALRGAAAFALGLYLAVTPWTARNYGVVGRFIPVNLQSRAALWGSTVRLLGIHPDHYNWGQLLDAVKPIYRRVTGESEYQYPIYVLFNEEMDDAFGREALRNLREKPEVYLGNALSSFLAFNFRVNSVLLKVFQHLQEPGTQVETDWFVVGHPQDFHSSILSTAYTLSMYLLTATAIAGAWSAICRKQSSALAPGAVYLCLCVAHALLYMDFMYYYVKTPFLFVFAGYFADACWDRELRLRPRGHRLGLATALSVLLAVPSLILSLAMLGGWPP